MNARSPDPEQQAESIGMLQTDVAVIKTDVALLKTDVTLLQTDVALLQTDVALLKTDVALLKTDVAILKNDVAILKTDVDVLKRDMAVVKATMATREDIHRLENALLRMEVLVERGYRRIILWLTAVVIAAALGFTGAQIVLIRSLVDMPKPPVSAAPR